MLNYCNLLGTLGIAALASLLHCDAGLHGLPDGLQPSCVHPVARERGAEAQAVAQEAQRAVRREDPRREGHNLSLCGVCVVALCLRCSGCVINIAI